MLLVNLRKGTALGTDRIFAGLTFKPATAGRAWAMIKTANGVAIRRREKTACRQTGPAIHLNSNGDVATRASDSRNHAKQVCRLALKEPLRAKRCREKRGR